MSFRTSGAAGRLFLGWKLSLCVGGFGEIAGRTPTLQLAHGVVPILRRQPVSPMETTVHAGRREADVVIG